MKKKSSKNNRKEKGIHDKTTNYLELIWRLYSCTKNLIPLQFILEHTLYVITRK